VAAFQHRGGPVRRGAIVDQHISAGSASFEPSLSRRTTGSIGMTSAEHPGKRQRGQQGRRQILPAPSRGAGVAPRPPRTRAVNGCGQRHDLQEDGSIRQAHLPPRPPSGEMGARRAMGVLGAETSLRRATGPLFPVQEKFPWDHRVAMRWYAYSPALLVADASEQGTRGTGNPRIPPSMPTPDRQVRLRWIFSSNSLRRRAPGIRLKLRSVGAEPRYARSAWYAHDIAPSPRPKAP
jgi:hypothetical protein